MEFLTRRDVIARLRQDLKGQTAAKWARDHGFSPAFVSMVLSGKKLPSPKILKALGLKRQLIFVADQ